MKSQKTLISSHSTKSLTSSQSYSLLLKYSPYLNQSSKKKQITNKGNIKQNKSKGVINQSQINNSSTCFTQPLSINGNNNLNNNNNNHTTLDSTTQGIQCKKITSVIPTTKTHHGLQRSHSTSQLISSDIKMRNHKIFTSTWWSYNDEKGVGNIINIENTKWWQDIVDCIHEIQEQNKESIKKQDENKEKWKNNISVLRSEIRHFQRKKVEYNYQNCKWVRIINNIIKNNDRFLKENEENDILSKEIEDLQAQVSSIRNETNTAIIDQSEVIKGIEDIKTTIKKVNHEISFVNKEKEEIVMWKKLLDNRIVTLKGKILHKVRFDSDFINNMTNIVIKEKRRNSNGQMKST